MNLPHSIQWYCIFDRVKYTYFGISAFKKTFQLLEAVVNSCSPFLFHQRFGNLGGKNNKRINEQSIVLHEQICFGLYASNTSQLLMHCIDCTFLSMLACCLAVDLESECIVREFSIWSVLSEGPASIPRFICRSCFAYECGRLSYWDNTIPLLEQFKWEKVFFLTLIRAADRGAGCIYTLFIYSRSLVEVDKCVRQVDAFLPNPVVYYMLL